MPHKILLWRVNEKGLRRTFLVSEPGFRRRFDAELDLVKSSVEAAAPAVLRARPVPRCRRLAERRSRPPS
jgi:hypothetical protein